MRASITPLLIGAAIASSAVILALGPLDPPPGPVSPTAPSLADLDAKLDQLVLAQSNTTDLSGPYEIFRSPTLGDLTSAQNGTLIAEGRIYVHSVSVLYCKVAIFDGPGTVDAAGRPLTGDWIGRAFHIFSVSGTGRTQFGTTTVPVEAIVENGLYAAWNANATDGSLVIRYKRLPPESSQ